MRMSEVRSSAGLKLLVLVLLGAVGALGYRLWLLERAPTAAPSRPKLEAAQPTMEEAFAKVHAQPRNPEVWTALGDAQSAQHELEAAEHAYRTAIRLGDNSGLAHARLGFLFYGRQQDEAALDLLQKARAKGAAVPMLDFTIEALEAKAEPEAPAPPAPESPEPEPVIATAPGTGWDAGFAPDLGPEPEPEPAPPVEAPQPVAEPVAPRPLGPCEIPATRRGRTYTLELEIGRSVASLIIDTGASITVLSEEFVARAGIRPHPVRRVLALTANGRTEFRTAVVPEIGLGDRVVESSWVAICPDCAHGTVDGLLGLDLQAAFGLHLDPSAEVVRFADCEP